jgi:hypothetical protein
MSKQISCIIYNNCITVMLIKSSNNITQYHGYYLFIIVFSSKHNLVISSLSGFLILTLNSKEPCKLIIIASIYDRNNYPKGEIRTKGGISDNKIISWRKTYLTLLRMTGGSAMRPWLVELPELILCWIQEDLYQTVFFFKRSNSLLISWIDYLKWTKRLGAKKQ